MILTLSNCMLNRGKLFTREVISFKRNFMCCAYNAKKQAPTLQGKYFSTDQNTNENSNRELIYTGNITDKVRNLKLFSLTSSVGSVFLQPFLYMNMQEESSATTLAMVFAMANLIAVCSPAMVHAVAKRYVLEIYYEQKKKEYVAIVYSLFLKRNEVKFKPEDISEPQTRFTGLFTTCYARNYPLLFDPTLFTNPLHYKAIMGYGEKIEFEVEKLKLPRPINRLPVIESTTNSRLESTASSHLESAEDSHLEDTKNKAKI